MKMIKSKKGNKMAAKQDIRKEFIQIRKAIQDKEERSKDLFQQLISTKLYQDAHFIGCYVSLNNEVNTHFLIKQAFLDHKRIAVPKVVGEHEMLFYEITSFDQLQSGSFHIQEPTSTQLIEKKMMDFILVPGVAFDRQFHRLGYGKGFYDNYLKDYQNKKIGVCFKEQICDQLPYDEWDICLDELLISK